MSKKRPEDAAADAEPVLALSLSATAFMERAEPPTPPASEWQLAVRETKRRLEKAADADGEFLAVFQHPALVHTEPTQRPTPQARAEHESHRGAGIAAAHARIGQGADAAARQAAERQLNAEEDSLLAELNRLAGPLVDRLVALQHQRAGMSAI